MLFVHKKFDPVCTPLLDTFRTFKGAIEMENIKLNQIILQY
jgi:hypothetical protein